ncbi:alpha-amylase [Bordetella pertussis]|nr:alpha-amylase [Bordetella pertussis]
MPGPPSACDRDARVVFEHVAPSVAHGSLAPGDNDRWHARFAPRRVGLHEFRVCAWRDTWLTFCRELRLKHEADQDIALDLAEDAAHLRTALARRQARGDARPSKRPCPC